MDFFNLVAQICFHFGTPEVSQILPECPWEPHKGGKDDGKLTQRQKHSSFCDFHPSYWTKSGSETPKVGPKHTEMQPGPSPRGHKQWTSQPPIDSEKRQTTLMSSVNCLSHFLPTFTHKMDTQTTHNVHKMTQRPPDELLHVERKTGTTGCHLVARRSPYHLSEAPLRDISRRGGHVGPASQGVPEKFDFPDFFDTLLVLIFWQLLTDMVGFWTLRLKIIPNHRAMSAQGPPGVFGQRILSNRRTIQRFRQKNRKETHKIVLFVSISTQTAASPMS